MATLRPRGREDPSRLVGDGPRCGGLRHYKPTKGEKRLSSRKESRHAQSALPSSCSRESWSGGHRRQPLARRRLKQYQFTGTITEVDAKGKTMRVDKGGEIWEFSTEGLKDLKLKKGDKVTVYYHDDREEGGDEVVRLTFGEHPSERSRVPLMALLRRQSDRIVALRLAPQGHPTR